MYMFAILKSDKIKIFFLLMILCFDQHFHFLDVKYLYFELQRFIVLGAVIFYGTLIMMQKFLENWLSFKD